MDRLLDGFDCPGRCDHADSRIALLPDSARRADDGRQARSGKAGCPHRLDPPHLELVERDGAVDDGADFPERRTTVIRRGKLSSGMRISPATVRMPSSTWTRSSCGMSFPFLE